MKHFSITTLAISLLFAAAPVQQSRGAWFFDASSHNGNHSALRFYDENAYDHFIYWVLNLGVPQFTVDVAGNNTGWYPAEVGNNWWRGWYGLGGMNTIISDDGALWLQWFRGDYLAGLKSGVAAGTGPLDVAFWKIVNGAIVGAGTYSTVDWLPWEGHPLGEGFVQSFFQDTDPYDGEDFVNGFSYPESWAVWIVNATGGIQAVLGWFLDFTGWQMSRIHVAEAQGMIVVEFVNTLNSAPRQITQYVFDSQGNWLNAYSYAY